MSYQLWVESQNAYKKYEKNPGDIEAYTRYLLGESQDGDQIPDSIEYMDGNPRTDPLIFNSLNSVYKVASETKRNYPFITGGERNA